MSEMIDSPQVLALKARIAELERENLMLRAEVVIPGFGDQLLYTDLENEPVRKLSFNGLNRQLNLVRAAEWNVNRDQRSGKYHAVGECWNDSGDCYRHTYFMDSLPRSSTDLIDVLGRMHKKVVLQLAQEWAKRFLPKSDGG